MDKNFKLPFFVFVLLFAICYLLFAIPVQASEEFITRYDVAYEVQSSGQTNVSQKISLTNKLSNIYVTEYSLSIDNLKIQNIKAYDRLGPVGVSTAQADKITTINLVFNEKVVGKDKTLNFTLEYETPDLTSKKGQVWELIVPKLTNIDEIDDYYLTLKVPSSFGRAAYLSPKATRSQPPSYFFDKTSAIKGIMAAFGECQIFDFNISYHLENINRTAKKAQITLPPETAYQKIIYQKLEPKPEEIIVDDDGNWLATYMLNPQQKIDIIASGSAQIFLTPINMNQKTAENLEECLRPQEYWQTQDLIIKKKASELVTPEKIYDFVVKTLNYDYKRIGQAERLGAIGALNNPNSALCMEFTDLFIALCRAAGIPAREINGFAFTENPHLKPLSLKQDILHAWPEYWDEKGKIWVPIDPTWEVTTGGVDFFNKLDLNHFAFVIHGRASDFPPAPGQGGRKNIEVNFAENLPKIKEEVQVEFDLPKKSVAGFSISGNIIVENAGNVAFHNLDLAINSQHLFIPNLPPFANRSFPVNLQKSRWWQRKIEKVIVDVNQYHFEEEIDVQPFFFQIGSFLTKLFLHAKSLFK